MADQNNGAGDEITEEQEDALFNEVSEGRDAGKSLRALSGTGTDDAGAGGDGADDGAGGDGADGAAGDGAGTGKGKDGAAGAGADGAGGAGSGAGADGAAGAGAGKGKDGAAGAGGDGSGAGKGKDGTAGAGADGAAAAGAGAGKGKDGAADAGDELTTAGAEAFVGEFRKNLVQLGDMVIEPASKENGKDVPAVTLKDFDEQYPGVAKRIDLVASLAFRMAHQQIMKQVAPQLEYVTARRAVEAREALLGDIDGEGDGKVAGARSMVGSKEFADWYQKQPAAIQDLGRSADKAHAVRLLKFFQADTGYKGAEGAGPAGGGAKKRSDAERQAALDVAKAGGGGGSGRKPSMLGQVHSTSGGQETFSIDEDEADDEFNRLAAVPASQRAKA